ncbi:MAG: hypothetical protein IAC61_03430 [Firmicutes bacterium]|uniref:Uncharacterized protein n=1 Tax=Candidatus Alloenteromonas pullistercoris TaxID=2840785 RepID=A0A9D9DER4_9FIRM|nr:hypothetical protein [Candidatus Enteromonas pullistercoris]
MKEKVFISPEMKLKLLSKLGLDVTDVMLLCGCAKSKAFAIMRICRDEYGGQAGCMTTRITPRSLCRYMGADLKEEMLLLEEVCIRRENLLRKENGSVFDR